MASQFTQSGVIASAAKQAKGRTLQGSVRYSTIASKFTQSNVIALRGTKQETKQMKSKGIIRLCYRKVIDASSQKAWEKLVFESTYKEFLMQSQLYNQEKKYNTFGELLLNVPAAEKLHFLVSSAIIGYLQQLGSKMPDILNSLGKHFLEFKNYRFEIINSDIKNKTAHQVAINFYSEPLIWHDTIDNYLLLSPVNGEKNEDGVLTDMMQLQPFLSIYSLKTEE